MILCANTIERRSGGGAASCHYCYRHFDAYISRTGRSDAATAEATRPSDRKLTISGERPVIESTRVSARASKRGLPFLIPEIAPAHFGALDGYWVNGYLSNHSTSRDSLQVAGAAFNMPANQSDVRNRCAMISRTIPNVFVTPQSRDCGRKNDYQQRPLSQWTAHFVLVLRMHAVE